MVASRVVHVEGVPSWNCLTNVGASDSGMAMRPSANFHHQSSGKLPFSVLNEACCGVYHGSHSAKGHGNKADVRAFGAGPLMSLFNLSVSFPVSSSNYCISLLVPLVVNNCHLFRGPYSI
jgi:hypothetical protein